MLMWNWYWNTSLGSDQWQRNKGWKSKLRGVYDTDIVYQYEYLMMQSSGPYCHITIAAYIVNCICYRFWCSPLVSTWDSSSWSWWGWTPWRTRPWTTGPSPPSCRSCTWGWQTPPRWLWGSAVSPGSTDAGTAGRREAGTDWLQAGTLQHYQVTQGSHW